MSVNVMLHSFTGGEWAPSLYGRTDLEKYASAARKMKNFYPHPHGGVSNRPGLEFIAKTKLSTTKKCRLIPFQFSTVQTYVLEFGDSYMRVIKDGGQVLETSKSITAATKANPVVITSVSHGYSNGDYVIISGVVGMTQLNNRTFKVANKTTDTFELQDEYGVNVNGTGYSTYTSGGTAERIYQITTPYAEADLPLLKYEQSADVIYLFHPSYAPRKLSRTGHTSWTLTTITFASSITAPTGFNRTAGSGTGYSYLATAVASNGEESGVSSSASGGRGDTFGWTAVTGADHYNVYEQHNGIYYYIGEAGSTSFVVPSSPDVDYEITPPKATNPFSSSGNYPGCGAFYEQRLVYARTNNKPQTLFGSVIGSFENMNVSSPIQDDDAFEFTMDSRQVNEIRWLVALNSLIIGTSGSEWKMDSGTMANTITPTSVNRKLQSRWGVAHTAPIVIGNTVLFIESSGRVVRDMLYSLQVDGYDGKMLSIMSTHLFEGRTISEWAYQQHPDNIVWCVMSDGALIALSYVREHEIWGWHQHETDGDFESVACIPTASGLNEVYFVVRRYVNGRYERYIERLSQRLYSQAKAKTTNDIKDAFFVDSGLSFDNPVSISAVTAADPVVVTTATAHGFSNGDIVDVESITWQEELNEYGNYEQPDQLNNKRYVVANKTSTTFELQDEQGNDIDGSAFLAYVEGGYVRKAVTSVSGLDHLEGRGVVALADGSVVNNLSVTSGVITLPNPASRIHVGLAYECDLETMEIEYQTPAGSAQGALRDSSSVVLRLQNTREIWLGGDEDHLFEAKFREDENYGDPIRLVTGDKEMTIAQSAERHNRVFLRVKNPVPATILALIVRVSHGD